MSRSSAVPFAVVALACLVALGAEGPRDVGTGRGGLSARAVSVVAGESTGLGPSAASLGEGPSASGPGVGGGGAGPPPGTPPGTAATVPSSDGPAAHPWRWPLAPRPPVLRRFRAPPDPYAAGHRGLDLGTRADDVVLAVADGVVTHSGSVAGRGTVTVLHPGGLRSSYEPIDPGVHAGDVVAAGQPLGVVDDGVGSAASHCGARTCLHLGARRGETYVDPWPLLAGGPLALLPLG